MPPKAFEILGYGVIGLGFLLAFLAYRLLMAEQKRSTVRKNMLTAIKIFMGFSFSLCGLGLASELLKRPGYTDPENAQVVKENVSLKGKLQKGLSPEEFCSVLNKGSDCQLDKKNFYEAVQSLISDSDTLKKYKSHYGFILYKIEMIMPNYGTSIDTRILDESRTETYKLIQTALRDINAYRGNIDGDPKATSDAVKEFQKAINIQQKAEIFEEKTLGVFGYRTLEAIRIAHRTLN